MNCDKNLEARTHKKDLSLERIKNQKDMNVFASVFADVTHMLFF